MQIKKIRLVNFRGMKDLTVEFDSGVNIIIGDNGAGKTSLLSGICIALSSLFDALTLRDIDIYRPINKEEVRVTSVMIGDVTENTEAHFPVSIEADLIFARAEYRYKVVKENELSTSLMLRDDLKNLMKEHISNSNINLSILNYQSAERGTVYEPKNNNSIAVKAIERKQGYQSTFRGDSIFVVVREWCAQMDYTEYKLRHDVREYKNFKAIVSKFMKELNNMTVFPRVDYAPKIGQLIFFDGNKGELISNLSAGYQSILCMIMELAYRAVLLNPTLDDFSKLEGVVLIDEIDVHLHPKWQWRIIGALRATFPKVQFIVATHSPIVLSSAEDAKLIFMTSPNEVEPLENAYGIDVNDVLELRQQSAGMLPELKECRKRISRCLNNNDIQGAEAVIEEAATQYNKDSALVKKLQEFFQMNKWIAEA